MKRATATIRPGSPRAASWHHVFGAETVPIEAPIPHAALRPEGGSARFYKLAVRHLRPDQRDRLVDHLADLFDIPRDEVEREIDGPHGVPILAEDLTITTDARAFL